ncbi:MAG: putative glutathione S-transferase [Caulobacteraceae bacterium]|nr:putative glutathione S-transferase [Caulobacteraceae bacterium]
MSEFVVHGIIGSPYVRAVLLGLEEKGRSYRLAPLPPGGHRAAEHLARHPFGRVPAVEHGDFRLYETQAVLRYLERLFPQPALIPEDPRAAARMDQLMGINDWYLMPQISAPIVFPLVVAPRLGLPSDESRIAECLPRAEVCIGEIARLLGDQAFAAGADLSLADLMLAPQLSMLAECAQGRALMAPHPALSAWLERMQDRRSMRDTTWDRLLERQQAA